MNLRTCSSRSSITPKDQRSNSSISRSDSSAKDHPGRPAMEKFSAKLRKLGFSEPTIGLGPDKHSFMQMLDAAGLNENLNPKRSASHRSVNDA